MEKEEKSTLSFDAWQAEKEFLNKAKEAHPELFLRPVLFDDEKTLQEVGIENVFGKRMPGHIKLFPEDFIVEEVSKDKTLHTIEDGPAVKEGTGSAPEESRTVWAEVVKMGLDTIEAVNALSQRLNVEKKFIGVAGIKDKYALTSQAITLRGVNPRTRSGAEKSSQGSGSRSIDVGIKLEDIIASSFPNFFLKNITVGKGALQTGDLLGNRFTLFIRTPQKLNQQKLEEELRDLEEQGFWNFFYLQRFGTPRLISHKLGLLILQGKFEETVKASLTYGSEREIPFFQNFRRKLLEYWGDWPRILAEIEPMSYSFRSEKRMVEYLVGQPADFIGALNQIPEQIKLWVYAYASFLFNKTLSNLIQSGRDVPYEMPLALSRDPRVLEFYGDFFRSHKAAPPFPALKNFPYIQKMEKDVETLKKFTLHNMRVVEGGVVIDFFLEKAAYATTFLSHLFILSAGQPLPEGISLKEIDSKAILGTGSIEPLKKGKFRELFEMRKEMDIFKDDAVE